MTRIAPTLTLMLALFLVGLMSQPVEGQLMPHAVFGTVTDTGGSPVDSAEVTVTNLRTGVSASNITDSLGRYTVDLSCQTGDRIKVEAKASGLYGTREVVVGDAPLTQCDISMEPAGISMPVLLGIIGGIVALSITGMYYVSARKHESQGAAERPKRRRSR